MAETITVKIGNHQKWQRLLLMIQNSPHASFRIAFKDNEEARTVLQKLYRAIWDRPSWFNLVLCQRGCDIYIIKPDKAQKVVILDG